MGAWTGKFVIGLTGNIATGKSEVRVMLERLDALGIDADALVHLLLIKNAPGYVRVVDNFGKGILTPQGEIDRDRLGGIVFADPQRLAQLEGLLHPIVIETVGKMIRESEFEIIVVEAIKLIEAGIAEACDSVWVTTASKDVQMSRLTKFRGLSPEAAAQRIEAQTPQADKIAHADVIISNNGSLEETWRQVLQNWQALVPKFRSSSS